MANIENVVHESIDVKNTSTLVFGEDMVGTFMLLQNVSDTDMFLSFTGAAEMGRGISLKAGANFLLDVIVVDAPLTAIHGSTGNKQLLVTRA